MPRKTPPAPAPDLERILERIDGLDAKTDALAHRTNDHETIRANLTQTQNGVTSLAGQHSSQITDLGRAIDTHDQTLDRLSAEADVQTRRVGEAHARAGRAEETATAAVRQILDLAETKATTAAVDDIAARLRVVEDTLRDHATETGERFESFAEALENFGAKVDDLDNVANTQADQISVLDTVVSLRVNGLSERLAAVEADSHPPQPIVSVEDFEGLAGDVQRLITMVEGDPLRTLAETGNAALAAEESAVVVGVDYAVPEADETATVVTKVRTPVVGLPDRDLPADLISLAVDDLISLEPPPEAIAPINRLTRLAHAYRTAFRDAIELVDPANRADIYGTLDEILADIAKGLDQ